MQQLSLGLEHSPSPWVLCLGAHSDDIEIGCGGTILRLIRGIPAALASTGSYSVRTRRATWKQSPARESLSSQGRGCEDCHQGHSGTATSLIQDADIKDYFEELKQNETLTLILTHYREDLHQDHRVINELTWNTFRDHLILEYEIPKYDGGLGSPNVFISLTSATVERKIDLLLEHFQTQANKHWFSRQTFESILAIRGIESHSLDQFAEAFYGRKVVV